LLLGKPNKTTAARIPTWIAERIVGVKAMTQKLPKGSFEKGKRIIRPVFLFLKVPFSFSVALPSLGEK